MKRFSCKAIAILTAVFFISSGIFVPTTFAGVNELILNEIRQPVPTITLEQANAQTAPVIQNEIPSGVAVQNESPLSLATPSLQAEEDSVPEGAIQVHEGESIQSAINQAQAGDVVYVHAGTYHESITLKQGVFLQGESMENTIIDGQGQYRDVILARGDNRIEGLTVTGGAAYNGGPTSAVRIEGNNVRFSGNAVINNGGYGVYLRAGNSIVIERSFFKGNNLAIQHPHGSVIGVVIQNNTMVSNNIAINILDGVTPQIENNIITGSTFCAIYEFNWNAYSSGQLSRGFATVANNAFFSNAWRPTYYGSSTPPAVEALTDGNIQADPQFNDPAHGDYRLIPGSPAIGMGAYPDPVVPDGWMRTASNPGFAFRVQEDGLLNKMLVLNLGSGQQNQVAELPAGGQYPHFQDIVDVSPDGATVIYSVVQSAEAATVYIQRTSDSFKKISIEGVLQSVTFISSTENALLDFCDGKSILLRLPASPTEIPQILEEHKPNGVVSYFNVSDGALARVAIEQTGGTDPLPSVEIVRPVITQAPNPMNQWTLKFNQSMKGVRYEVQFRTSLMSGDWQPAGSFVADRYGEVSWQDPAPDRGNTVFYRVVAKELTTAADLLTQINLLYFDPAFGMVETTHEYPVEGWLQKTKTQPSNFGFYAYLLATIAAGDLVTSKITKTQAISRLNTMMDHLLVDQADQDLCYKGLFPWFEYTDSDWQRMAGPYGQQVSFEDNTNFTNALAVAYGALLDESLANNSAVHGSGGILTKIDTFIENQREGYLAMYNNETQTFAQTMQISDGSLSGGIVLFGAESSAPLLFLILQYGDAFPASAYAKLNFATRTYTQGANPITVVAPFSGAFQMYWPALLMPESENPDLRGMLETYTDVQLDYAVRNAQPGFLSAAYDVQAHNLLEHVWTFSWAGDDVTGAWESNRLHITSPTAHGVGVVFTEAGLDVSGFEMQFRYSSTTEIPNARIEFKKTVNGVQHIFTHTLPSASTGGVVRTEKFVLPSEEWLNDLDEVVFAVSGSSSPLDVSLYSFLLMDDTYQIAYNFPLGIGEIAQGGATVETTPSVYNLGAAYMFRPTAVEALLQGLISDHRDLVSDHGLWEGKNMEYDQVVQEQVFNNVTTFVLGMTGSGPSYMTQYLANKGLTAELESIWDSQTPVVLNDLDRGDDFSWNGYKGTPWNLPENSRVSGRQIRLTYQSSVPIQGAKVELKHSTSNVPIFTETFDLSATGDVTGEIIIDVPESILYWYISNLVVLFPEVQGYPSAVISRIVLAPEGIAAPPEVVVNAETPHLIKTTTLKVNYTVDGIVKTKLFENLQEGANILTITEGQTVVSWSVTVDTIAPGGAIAINSNDAYTNASSVILTVDASDVTSGLDQVRLSFDGGMTWDAWTPFATTTLLELPGTDGTKDIRCQIMDKAGNVATFADTIILDQTAPTGAVVINNNAGYVATIFVTLNLSVSDSLSGVSQRRFSTDGGLTWTGWENYTTTKSITLPNADGIKEVQCQVKDRADNINTFVDTIVLDRVAPSGSFTINDNAVYARSTSVTLNLAVSDDILGVYQMRFSTDGGTVWTSWQSYSATTSLTLPGGDGSKTVKGQFKDFAGNTTTLSQSIILDRTFPTGTVSINGGAIYTNTTSVNLSLTASDATSGVDQIRFSTTSGLYWTDWQSPVESMAFTLPEGDGTKRVTVAIRDRAGNIWWIYDEIIQDISAPTGSVTISNGFNRINSSAVTLQLSASDVTSGVDKMSFSSDGGATWSDWEMFFMAKTLDLPPGDGVKEVRVRFKDNAGNVNDAISNTIICDSTIPLLEDQSFVTSSDVRKTMILGPLLDDSGTLLSYSFSASEDLWVNGQFSILKNQLSYVPNKGFTGSGVITVQSSNRTNITQHNVNMQVVAPSVSTPNDPSLSLQYGLSLTDAVRAWNFSRGEGVRVAVIDTGINMLHADLAENIFTNPGEIAGDGIDNDGNGFIDDVNGWDFYNSDNNPVDDNGHGSHVGGIIAALSDNEQGGSGIAPDSELIPIKVLNSDGGGSTIDYVFQKVAQGIRYAVQIGAQVINMSLSYATSGISSLVVQDVQDAILEAHTAGVVVVVAAGNNNSSTWFYTPASMENVITVSATDSEDLRATYMGSYFSNYGYGVDLAAPGANIYSTYINTTYGTGYKYEYGTSMSAPFVTGLAALLLAQDPSATEADVFRRMKFSAQDLGATGRDDYFGYGRIDAFRALSYDYYDSGVIKEQRLETPDENGWNRLFFDTDGYLTGGAYVGTSGIAGLGAALVNEIAPVAQPRASLLRQSFLRLSLKQHLKFAEVRFWDAWTRGWNLKETREDDDSEALKFRFLLTVDQKKNDQAQKTVSDERARGLFKERTFAPGKTQNQKIIHDQVQNELILKSVWSSPLIGTALSLALSTWSAGDM